MAAAMAFVCEGSDVCAVGCIKQNPLAASALNDGLQRKSSESSIQVHLCLFKMKAMNEPKRQHLVPRCYLKKFGSYQKKEWYVHAYDKTKDGEIIRPNIKNVCVELEYYSFENLPDDKKRFLEKFYANNIETEYDEIYNVLVKTKDRKLSDKLKYAIIKFIVSQGGVNYNPF